MITLKEMSPEQAKLLRKTDLARDFPKSELKPWWVTQMLYRQGCYDFLGTYQEETLVGYAWVYRGDNGCALLDYLAVLPNYRGQGIGSKILSDLKKLYATLILESENPDAAPDPGIAVRRLDFYARNGMEKTGLRVILFGVDFYILSSRPIDGIQTMQTLYRGLFGPILSRTKIRYL